MLEKIKKCFGEEEYLYSQHAREEMELEDLGEIKDSEVFEAVLNGKIIEDYPEDKPYPSCLVYRKTSDERPLHIVCAYAEDVNMVIIPQLSEKNSFNEIFPDGWAILGSFMPHFKIPLNPPFPKGDDNGFSPLAKGS